MRVSAHQSPALSTPALRRRCWQEAGGQRDLTTAGWCQSRVGQRERGCCKETGGREGPTNLPAASFCSVLSNEKQCFKQIWMRFGVECRKHRSFSDYQWTSNMVLLFEVLLPAIPFASWGWIPLVGSLENFGKPEKAVLGWCDFCNLRLALAFPRDHLRSRFN